MLLVPTFSDATRLAEVDVVFVREAGVVRRTGRVRARAARGWEVELDSEAPSVGPGTRVLLDVRGPRPKRVLGTAATVSGRRLRLVEKDVVEPNQRTWPRLCGAIPLRWRRLGAGVAGAWHTADPLMNFSVVGLRFGVPEHALGAGDMLEIEMGVADGAERWPGLARVVRAETTPAEEVAAGEDPFRVAVELIDLPDAARDALAAFTLRIQRALAGG